MPMPTSSSSGRSVLTGPANERKILVLASTRAHRPASHESLAREAVAQRLGRVLGYDYGGAHDPSNRYDAPLYFVPDDTLTRERADALGIRTEDDLFGGVVPHAFAATKVISHPSVGTAEQLPAGWSHRLSERLADAVLPGFSAFSAADARMAAQQLFALGDVRIKTARGIGGAGQTVARHIDDVDTVLAGMDEAELREFGVVIEQNLIDAVTYSIGQLHVAGARISYHGTQRLARNHHGHEVYGGSDLTVVRGTMRELLQLEISEELRTAVERALRYDEAVAAEFSGFFASRRNYDVIRGLDRDGNVCCGVLEQSWRIGGASAAEVAALEALGSDSSLRTVRAATREIYADAAPPPGAVTHYRGEDAVVGFLTKYSFVEPHGMVQAHGN